MIYCSNNSLGIYPTLVTFKENGVDKEIYTNTPSLYETMCNNNPAKFSNFKTANVIPTEEQLKRFEALKEVGVEASDGFSGFYTSFVKDGYIEENAPEVMIKDLLPKFEALTKQHLINKYKADLASIRYDREVGGVEFENVVVKSDRESQSTITSTAMMFSTGILTSTEFKCENDEWIVCDKAKFDLLTMTVAGHVKFCFTAEAKLLEYLNSLPAIELYESKIDLNVLFEDTYNKVKEAATGGSQQPTPPSTDNSGTSDTENKEPDTSDKDESTEEDKKDDTVTDNGTEEKVPDTESGNTESETPVDNPKVKSVKQKKK